MPETDRSDRCISNLPPPLCTITVKESLPKLSHVLYVDDAEDEVLHSLSDHGVKTMSFDELYDLGTSRPASLLFFPVHLRGFLPASPSPPLPPLSFQASQAGSTKSYHLRTRIWQ